MATQKEILSFLDSEMQVKTFGDYPTAFNGVQFGDTESLRKVKKICAACDAGLYQFSEAKKLGAQILLVHHGMLWNAAAPFTGANYEKMKTLSSGDITLYSVHLPLDAHDIYGNNAQLVKKLKLEAVASCFEYCGNQIGKIALTPKGGRAELARRLKNLFKKTYKGIEFGSANPKHIAVCSGSAAEAIHHLKDYGLDTLITGEVKEHYFEVARELKLNIYPCGHYATECFGVQALGRAVAQKFGIEYEFIEVDNPL